MVQSAAYCRGGAFCWTNHFPNSDMGMDPLFFNVRKSHTKACGRAQVLLLELTKKEVQLITSCFVSQRTFGVDVKLSSGSPEAQITDTTVELMLERFERRTCCEQVERSIVQ